VTSEPSFDAFTDGVDYPMYVVTANVGERRGGCLVGFATQTSIDPVRFLVCISRANATAPVAREASHLAVHLIGPDQRELARLFGEESGEWTDKFASVAWREGPSGVPVLEGCPATLVGEVVVRLDLGDHEGFLLDPVAVEGKASSGVLTFQQLKDLRPGHPA